MVGIFCFLHACLAAKFARATGHLDCELLWDMIADSGLKSTSVQERKDAVI